MIYFISDTHFGHEAIISYCHRPFRSIDEMNETLIKNWNETVSDNDTIYFLGDFSFCGYEKTRDILNRLKGKKIIIVGNHEKKGIQGLLNLGWDVAFETPIEIMENLPKIGLVNLILSHQPQYISDNKFNIHGHIHDAKLESEYPDMNPKNHLCVSVEKIDYKPISLQEVMERYVKEYFIEKGEF